MSERSVREQLEEYRELMPEQAAAVDALVGEYQRQISGRTGAWLRDASAEVVAPFDREARGGGSPEDRPLNLRRVAMAVAMEDVQHARDQGRASTPAETPQAGAPSASVEFVSKDMAGAVSRQTTWTLEDIVDDLPEDLGWLPYQVWEWQEIARERDGLRDRVQDLTARAEVLKIMGDGRAEDRRAELEEVSRLQAQVEEELTLAEVELGGIKQFDVDAAVLREAAVRELARRDGLDTVAEYRTPEDLNAELDAEPDGFGF
jgi:hypothetical protein